MTIRIPCTRQGPASLPEPRSSRRRRQSATGATRMPLYSAATCGRRTGLPVADAVPIAQDFHTKRLVVSTLEHHAQEVPSHPDLAAFLQALQESTDLLHLIQRLAASSKHSSCAWSLLQAF